MPAAALTCLPVAVTGVEVDHVADPDEDPAAQAMLAADAARVRSLVAQLPRDQRRVICMHFGLGCHPAGFREISRRLGVSVGHAFALNRAGLARLREWF